MGNRKKLTNTTPLEADEQKAVVEYLDLLKDQGRVILFTAFANEIWTPSWSQRAKMKSMGVRKGFPDMMIITQNNAFFIEMKRSKGSYVRPEQKEWHKELRKKGIACFVCKGFDEAKKVIDNNL